MWFTAAGGRTDGRFHFPASKTRYKEKHMRDRSTRVLEALRSAQGFLDAHDTLFPDVNKSGARKTLDDVVAQLTAHAVNQDGSTRVSKGETANQRTLRLALRFNHMKPLAAAANVKVRDVPRAEALTLPSSKMKGLRLVNAAGAMADAATPHTQDLIDAGLPADFIPQLRQAADALNASLDVRAVSRQSRAGATKGIGEEEKRGSDVLKLLDALVIPKLGNDVALIAGWKNARKVHAKPGPVIGSQAVARSGGSPNGPQPTAPSTSTSVPGSTGVSQPTTQPIALAA